MKIGVSVYSYNRYFREGTMTLTEAVASAAEIGFTGFEMLPRYFAEGKGTPAGCRELKDMLADAGLEMSCYTLASNFGLPEGDARRTVVDTIRHETDMAVVLGAKVCRIESTFGPQKDESVTFEDMLERVVRGTKEVAAHALTLGVRLGLENHGRYMGSFHTVAQLIKDVDSPAYQAVPDIGNFFVVDEDPLAACRELAKFAIHVHAKDFRRKPAEPKMGEGWWTTPAGCQIQGAVVGEGDVPVRECLRALRDRGYDGYLSVEHESPEDPIEGLKRSRANLEEMVSSLS
ncbi:MAG TPA: sugar phosphate isomerase/epimerase family protein [Planctomycetota bacterium]|nr:sugar phosphate isomerase/epimerase family protein [Planctomycetota bacterium]